MATCKHCWRPLILKDGKCLRCGKAPHEPTLPYSQYAGQSIIPGAKTDRFGNPQGSQYDLAKDGAFKGYKIVVLALYHYGDVPGTNIMSNAAPALQKKGMTTKMFVSNECNDVKRIQEELNNDKCQLWLISDDFYNLSSDCCKLIYDHFNRGRGLYIWSDNDPLYADSNVLLRKLFNTEMSGNYAGDQVLTIQSGEKRPGIIKNHPITTGLQNFYEGITISNVRLTQELKPLVYSSDGKIVTAYYDMAGKRALIDGGFTRLFYKWDSAGTDRFVVNCAAWLTNIERFGYHPE